MAHATVRDNNTLLEIVTDVGDVAPDTRARMMRTLIARGGRVSKALWTDDPEARDVLIEEGALAAGDAPALIALKSNLMHADATTAADDWLRRGIEPVGFWMVAAAGDVEGLRSFFNEDGSPPDRTESILGHLPMGRLGAPEELVGAAIFLAAEKASSYVTGSDIVVDGGFLAMTI